MTAKGLAMKKASAWVVCGVAVLASAASAQPVITGPDANGITWAEVGDPGNVPARAEDYPLLEPLTFRTEVGQVDYTFRMSQTELTIAQQFEFVQAYTRVFPSALGDSRLSGDAIWAEDGQWHLYAPASPYAALISHTYAMQLCNWLQSGKQETPEAFTTGAYNVAQFGATALREPDAQYWLPSLDEWVKAMHYDPNRSGDGQGGYWLYPTMSDSVPVGGAPGTPGAQTGAGEWDRELGTTFPVGSYPDALSPWGVLDGFGAHSEWLDDSGFDIYRYSKGADDIETLSAASAGQLQIWFPVPASSFGGLRIASIPSPNTFAAMGVILTLLGRKRR